MSYENEGAIDRETLPYRPCAGVVLFNRQGKVFLGKRVQSGGDVPAHAWQLPQGGIDKGEEPIDAALRELFEETSVRTASILTAAPDWIIYDVPDDMLGKAYKGKFRGQKQRWFAMLFEGEDDEIDVLHPGGGEHPAEFEDWRWEDLERVPELIVPFKKKAYEEVVAAFAHVPPALPSLAAGLTREGEA